MVDQLLKVLSAGEHLNLGIQPHPKRGIQSFLAPTLSWHSYCLLQDQVLAHLWC